MLKHFTEDTGQGDRATVGWVCFIPFLKIWDTLASFQMTGRLPVLRDLGPIRCRMGASSL